jgi:hypothetical protein
VSFLNGVGPATAGTVDGARKVVVAGKPSSRTLTKPQDQLADLAQRIRAELIGSDTCTACGHTAHGAAPVLALCRLLVDAGINPAQPLDAYRGDTLCLHVRSIGEAAKLEIDGKGCGFKRGAAVGIALAGSSNRRGES